MNRELIEKETFQQHLTTPEPLVSVVIPSYNKARFLPECVESFVNQDYQRFELLIVDDGSPDDTEKVAAELINRFPRHQIKYLPKPNGGVSDARNFGLARTSGRVVMTIDGDDFVRPSYLSTALRALRQGGDIFFANQQNVGKESGEWVPHPYDPYLIRYDNCIPITAVFDKRLWYLTGGFKVSLGYSEDWEFWVNCARFEPRVVRAEERLSCYRVNDEGIASTFIEGRWKDCVSIVIMADPDLYPVEEVLEAHRHYPSSDPRSLARAEKLASIHPNQPLLELMLGLQAEAKGQLEQAKNRYESAFNLTDRKDWQPAYRLAELARKVSNKEAANALFHLTRVLRPDLSRIVNGLITQ